MKKDQGKRAKKKVKTESKLLAAQPQAVAHNTTPCPICGVPVDRKRMKPHMMRFHGAAK
jgi:hypothetical protein